MVIKAGTVCTNRILRSVKAPAKPATATQPKKNKAMFFAHSASVIKNVHTKPADKNRL